MLHRIGIISDTHGLLRPEASAALAGCEQIVHAGDIGSAVVMETLRAIAPVVAVRGNNDRGDWAEGIPETAVVRIGSARLYVLHDLHQLDLDPERAGYQAVISGHSHRPGIERRGPVLFLNPGSAGPRRFSLPICLAHLQVRGREVEAEIIRLLG